jgi:hypothetical protein
MGFAIFELLQYPNLSILAALLPPSREGLVLMGLKGKKRTIRHLPLFQ